MTTLSSDDLELVVKLSENEKIFFILDKSSLIIKNVVSDFPFSNQFLKELEGLKSASIEDIYSQKVKFPKIQSPRIWNDFYEKIRFEISKILGRDFLYSANDPVVCYCFGIRRSEVPNKPKKLGKGCRTCLNYVGVESPKASKRLTKYKDISLSDWVLYIDEKIQQFDSSLKLNLKIKSFEFPTLVLTYEINLTQTEEEKYNREIQLLIHKEVGEGLFVFLTSC